jgi:predicted DNA-binding WGR domain protein
MDKFYMLLIELRLFSDATVTREWDRIGSPGQRGIELHETEAQAAEVLETWLKYKRRCGYVVREG